MKNLKFKIAAILLTAASALFYTSCDKRENKGTLGPVAPSALQGGSWIPSSSVLEFFDASGKKVFTDQLTNTSTLRFDEQHISVLYKDDNGFVANETYDYDYYIWQANGTKNSDYIKFTEYDSRHQYPLDYATKFARNIFLGTSEKSTLHFVASEINVGSLNSTDMSLVSHQNDNNGRGWDFVVSDGTKLTRITAERAELVIYYKKEKQLNDK